MGMATQCRALLVALLHTQDWEPVTITLQALSLVEKGEPVVQVLFTLCVRDQWSMWMQDGCKFYIDSYMASNGSRSTVTWTLFKNHLWPLRGRPNTKPPGDHGTPTAYDHWFILFHHVWGPMWINFHWNSIWLRARSLMTSHYTWGTMTTLHDFEGVLGWPLDTFFWAPTMSWSRLLARVWSGPSFPPWRVAEVAMSLTHGV